MSISDVVLPRPPREPDFRYPQDVARWTRELNDYLLRTLAAINLAAEDLTERQPLDPTLTAIAAFDATPGLVEQTGPDTFAKRAIGAATAASVPTRADADARYDVLGASAAVAAVKVTGPASATDNAIARFDAATGKLVQDSPVTVDDNGVLAGHRIGAWTTNADAAVNGYVTVTDNGGVSRKLATIA